MAECAFNATNQNIAEYVTCVSDAAKASIHDDIDNFYLLVCGTLVFLMQAGFAMLCAGSVRQKNQKNIMLKNLLDACGGALGFYFLGYGFYMGDGMTEDKTGFLGTNGFLLIGRDDYASFFFQFAFAATAATIVAGTVAERCKMEAYLCYSLFLTAFIYPVVARAGWNGGFLSGCKDFAGSGIVHMTGGCTALIAAIVLGPRKGRFTDEDGKDLPEAHTFPPSSVSLQILGTFILWVGWYGFNPGSTLGISGQGALAARCAVSTTLAAAAGCISSMFLNCLITKNKTGEVVYDLTFAMNGALGGLVGITAAPDTTPLWAAIIVGIIAGWVYLGASALLIKLKIDDAVDAVPVHFFCGMWGVLAAAIFDEDLGLFMGGGGNQLLQNIYLILFVIAWVGGLMTPFFIVLNMLGMFRVDSLEEDVGLDISHHGGAAYNLEAPKKEDVDELNTRRATAHGKVEKPEMEA
eukprot:CAMPEP_0194273298 /NCGR_PEP_ID=MMETSP0169-20130528/6654_1 /TAXON_ID=218684 /ORGANISM="Corethron pennatum, Strain L29A3" /LENGTH=464 /DNA_ID=CAMNT_0039016201 /DNA_START=182 /DNA_END=1576 /DNA_ORIENTATION=+